MESILSQNRISLSKAAQISGYHQDYLGQLCRLGKLKASKIGRNWYTTASELQALVNIDQALTDVFEEASQEVQPVEEVEQIEVSPVASSNYIISQVQDMPIQIEPVPQVAKSHHTLQTLITRMKLEELKTEVLQVTGIIEEISHEVDNHTEILKRHEMMLQNRVDLKNNYSPSLAFTQSSKPVISTIEFTKDSGLSFEPRSVRTVWLWPALALLLAVVVSGLFIVNITSSDAQPQLTTVIYKSAPSTELAPQVAGEQTQVQSQIFDETVNLSE